MKNRILVLGSTIAVLASAIIAQQPKDSDREHREMMPVHAKLLTEQKAQDAKIEKLLAEMNNSRGDKRIDAIVAVLNTLVEQRKAMNAEMAAHMDR